MGRKGTVGWSSRAERMPLPCDRGVLAPSSSQVLQGQRHCVLGLGKAL